MVETSDSRVTQEEADAFDHRADTADADAFRMHLGLLEDRMKDMESRMERLEQLVGGAPAAPTEEGRTVQAHHPFEGPGKSAEEENK